MKNIFTPIVITTTTVFIVSCGSDNSSSDANVPSQKTTWRLSSLDISYIHGDETIMHVGEVVYEYDSESELVRIKEQAVQPFKGDLTNQNITYNGESFSSGTLTSDEFQWPPSEAYRAITEITSISPSHWIEESYRYASQPDGSAINDSVYLLSGIEFKDWGDSYHEWKIMGADWSGIDTTDFDDTFFGPMNELNGDLSFNQPTTGGEIPHDEVDLFPKQHVIREYNNLGYLTYRAIYTEDQSKLWSEDIIEYIDGVTLSQITTHSYHLASPFTEIRRFISTANDSVKLEVSGKLNDGTPTLMQTATYEQAPCGPITLERSKKVVPTDFPICIQK